VAARGARAGTPRKDPFRKEFVRGMRDLGYVEGRNIAYEFRVRRDEQITGVQKVLGAAAWTYVAAAVCAIGSWLFYVFVCFPSAPLLIADDLVDRELLAHPLEQIQMLSPVNRVAMRD
jgi:Putative neutral zinc metallopeptidase